MIVEKVEKEVEMKKKKKREENWFTVSVPHNVKKLAGVYLSIPFPRVDNQVAMVSRKLALVNDVINIARQPSNLTD
jgi:hypothetical protein